MAYLATYYFPPIFIDPRSRVIPRRTFDNEDWSDHVFWFMSKEEKCNVADWPPFLSDPPPASQLEPKHTLTPCDCWQRFLLVQGAGRCVFFQRLDNKPPRMLLFLKPDGTGIFIDIYEGHSEFPPSYDIIPFQWQQYAPLLDVLTASEIDLEPICYRVLIEQIWEQMSEPLLNPAVVDGSEIEFLCGSMKDLQRLTRLIVYTEPGIFNAGESKDENR